jgi:putative component of membrane protein insertase Oxa1/YidC/SpoIIIJ protein YidD
MENWPPLIAAINGYQKYMSPHKGYHCAHRIVNGGNSCSEEVKQLISEHGLLASMAQIRQRFHDCKAAASYLNENRTERGRKKCGTKADKACAAADAISCIPSGCTDLGVGSVGNMAAGGCDACACTPF